MIGRGAELDAVIGGLERGLGTVVIGEAGVGKTMLAREVRRRLTEAGRRTEWILGAAAASEYPLQTFTDTLADPGPDLPSALHLLRRRMGNGPTGTAASTGRTGAGTVLLVDDAHLLDTASAELVRRLAASQEMPVVATVRAAETVPEHIRRLWSDGLCDRLDLAPLSDEDVAELVERVLGGPVEDRLPRLLARRAAGNALLLRELLKSALASGVIICSHGVWGLAGELPNGAGVLELIRDALGHLDERELRAARLLAIGEPLQLAVTEAAIGRDLLEELEDRRILSLQETIDGPVLTLAHPLYGEALRAAIGPLRLRRLRRELVEAIRRAGPPSPHDLMRSVVWRLDLADPVDPGELLAAAQLARSLGHPAAERLARAALLAGAGIPATVLLGDALTQQGRAAEAGAVFEAAMNGDLTQQQREAIVSGRVMGLTMLGQVAAAGRLIEDFSPEDELSEQLRAMHAQTTFFEGRTAHCLSNAERLFEDPAAAPATRTVAANCLLAGEYFAGRVENVRHRLEQWRPIADAARRDVPFSHGNVVVSAAISLAYAGRLDEAERLARRTYEDALRDDDPWLRPRGASGLGIVALLRGRPRTATRYFRITVISLSAFDALMMRYNLSYLIRGAALAGNLAEARDAHRTGTDTMVLDVFTPDWQCAEAVLLAAGGDLEGAARQAMTAYGTALDAGQFMAAAVSAHDAVRYAATPDACDATVRSAERCQGPLARCLAAHARARASGDPALLTAAATGFEGLGTLVLATEAHYAAAQAHRAASAGRDAVTALARATALRARCEDPALPWVAGFGAIEALTRREQRIALLAATGRADAEIAADLGISRRTVSNHLANAYRKLGITARRQLPDVLTLG